MMRKDFAMLILSHGRAGRINTINTLKRVGYTGKYYIIIDSEDEQKQDYINEYGNEKIIIFDKDEIAEKIDRGDNFRRKDIVLYARNKIWDIAEDLNLQYLMMLDDDYTGFAYRFDEKFEYNHKPVEDLDFIIEKMIKFYEKSNATTISFAQGGDFVFAKDTSLANAPKIKRKAMNTFLCSVDKQFRFMGSINEDVNAYVREQQLGKLIFMINFISINQKQTQSNEGGLTDIYLDKGTYIKSFYTILYSPSCVKLGLMGSKYRRIHHYIRWRNAVPKIISEKYKKGG